MSQIKILPPSVYDVTADLLIEGLNELIAMSSGGIIPRTVGRQLVTLDPSDNQDTDGFIKLKFILEANVSADVLAEVTRRVEEEGWSVELGEMRMERPWLFRPRYPTRDNQSPDDPKVSNIRRLESNAEPDGFVTKKTIILRA